MMASADDVDEDDILSLEWRKLSDSRAARSSLALEDAPDNISWSDGCGIPNK